MGICQTKHTSKSETTPKAQVTEEPPPPKIQKLNRKSKTLVLQPSARQAVLSSQPEIMPTVRNSARTKKLKLSVDPLSKHYSLMVNKRIILASLKSNEPRYVQHNVSGVVRNIFTLKKEEKAHEFIDWLIEEQYAQAHIVKVLELFQDRKQYHVVQEACTGGSLQELVASGPISELIAAIIMQQILEAINSLHEMGVVHGRLNLCSFGLLGQSNDFFIKLHDLKSIFIKDRGAESCNIYNPPGKDKNEAQSKSDDMWAVGVIAYSLLSGVQFKDAKNEENVYARINLELVSNRVSADCLRFLTQLLVEDPKFRLGAHHGLHHEWFKIIKNNYDMRYLRPLFNLSQAKKVTYVHECILLIMVDLYLHDFEPQMLKYFGDLGFKKGVGMTKAELLAMYDKVYRKHMNEEVDQIFVNHELSQNLSLTYNQILIGLLDKHQLIKQSLLTDCFKKLSNTSGFLTYKSLTRSLEASSEVLEKLFTEFFEEGKMCHKSFVEFMYLALDRIHIEDAL